MRPKLKERHRTMKLALFLALSRWKKTKPRLEDQAHRKYKTRSSISMKKNDVIFKKRVLNIILNLLGVWGFGFRSRTKNCNRCKFPSYRFPWLRLSNWSGNSQRLNWPQSGYIPLDLKFFDLSKCFGHFESICSLTLFQGRSGELAIASSLSQNLWELSWLTRKRDNTPKSEHVYFK